MITKEPSNLDLASDARLVADYMRRGLSPSDGEQLAMLFHENGYRQEVYRRAVVLLEQAPPRQLPPLALDVT